MPSGPLAPRPLSSARSGATPRAPRVPRVKRGRDGVPENVASPYPAGVRSERPKKVPKIVASQVKRVRRPLAGNVENVLHAKEKTPSCIQFSPFAMPVTFLVTFLAPAAPLVTFLVTFLGPAAAAGDVSGDALGYAHGRECNRCIGSRSRR